VPSADTHELGCKIARRYQLSIYDGMIAAAAQQAGCTTLYSEDMQHGLIIEKSLTVRNPFI
jgi:predicted nucleic acid-binding protein